jgi:hypothetical protein
LRENGLDFKYSDIGDEELDKIIQAYRETHSSSGVNYVISHLRTRQIRVQRQRVIDSIHRTDGIGGVLRTTKQKHLSRRVYHVKRPHALWHIDGHHKLILWGIVIHGMIDGFSRVVS